MAAAFPSSLYSLSLDVNDCFLVPWWAELHILIRFVMFYRYYKLLIVAIFFGIMLFKQRRKGRVALRSLVDPRN